MLRALVRATEELPGGGGIREIDVPQIREDRPWR
jgi:hypothetical protein